MTPRYKHICGHCVLVMQKGDQDWYWHPEGVPHQSYGGNVIDCEYTPRVCVRYNHASVSQDSNTLNVCRNSDIPRYYEAIREALRLGVASKTEADAGLPKKRGRA
jgi:hypothetical protein